MKKFREFVTNPMGRAEAEGLITRHTKLGQAHADAGDNAGARAHFLVVRKLNARDKHSRNDLRAASDKVLKKY